MTDYQQQQADLDGMLQAERKYSEGGQMTGMEVYAQYEVIKSRPLSDYEKRMVDAYRIGRDLPGFKNVSNIPL